MMQKTFQWKTDSRLAGVLVAAALTPVRAAPALAQSQSQAQRVQIVEVAAPVEVDGRLEETAWAGAPVVRLAWETYPGENGTARATTSCRLLYDESNLYFGCEATDSEPGSIRAFITDRDRTEGHDRVFLAVDPFSDARRAYQFGVNALGVQHDRLHANGEPDDAWDAIWSSAGRVTETGYVIEAAVPFRSLRFPAPAEAGAWRFYFEREWPREAAYRMRSHPLDRSNACVLCQTDLLEGLSEMRPGANLEVSPTLVADRRSARVTGSPIRSSLVADGPAVGLGLDVRWSPTPNVALNATMNPDFSQVEADAAQLQANIRFPLFFAEKRPFFLEGADLFATPLRAVFTRTVADPQAGLKLSGKLGRHAVGVLVARDAVNNLLFPAHASSGSASLDDDVTTVVARARRDVGASSAVGVLYTGRAGGTYANHVVGVDALLRPLRSVTATIQLLHSTTAYPEAVAAANGQPRGRFAAHAAHLEVRHATRSWQGSFRFDALGRDFRADAGFEPQGDRRSYDLSGGHTWWGEASGWLQRLAVNGGAWHYADGSGVPSNRGIWMNAEYDGPAQTQLWINPNLRRQRWLDREHDLLEVWMGGTLRPTAHLSFDVTAILGDAVDYVIGDEVDRMRITPRLTWRAGRHADLTVAHSLERLTSNGEARLDASVSELRAVYNFTPRLFARVITQYRDTDRAAAMPSGAVPARRRTLDGQFLLSYKVNPLTVVFAGYGEARDGEGEAAGITSLSPRQRSFFLKLGYAWRP